MGRYGSLLVRVWREASRHQDLESALAESASKLFETQPIAHVVVRRIDRTHGFLETVAWGVCREGAAATELRTSLGPDGVAAITEWCARQTIAHHIADAPPGLAASMLPAGVDGEALVGPLLATDGHPLGLLIFVAPAAQRFELRHERQMRLLLEPFAAWLENDIWRRELSALREAAEADKRSLLSRLGRTAMNDSIIGARTGLKGVMEGVDQVARTDVPVLILGETGSGKEVIARAIHEQSPRASGPFLRVNCGAISPELVDSELFGHERGSFTGAQGLRKGWFERADGGTLFLDECGELSLAAQVRLLRILQDGTFERVGGERHVHVNVRVVAATHRNLEAMVSDGRFRQDLWYRIAVFPIRLPPLRDRLDDIAEMARHFAGKSAQRLGMPKVTLTDEDVRLLTSYRWPGNVRELAAVIERAMILSDGKRLELGRALGPLDGLSRPVVATPDSSDSPLAKADEFASLDAAMSRHIEEALRRAHGRVEGPFGAAQLLAINPHTLRGRMRSLGIDWRRFRNRSEL